MPETECPECGAQLAEEALSCVKCGWPHKEAAVEDGAVSRPLAQAETANPTSYLLVGLGVGLVVGLFAGWLWGRSSMPAAGPAATATAPGKMTAPRPGGPATAPRPEPLRLRERGWKRDEKTGLCTGVFEVVTAPPGITTLRFAVMDAQGKVLGSDKVSAAGGIRPRTALELGFETEDCSKISKWKVEIVE